MEKPIYRIPVQTCSAFISRSLSLLEGNSLLPLSVHVCDKEEAFIRGKPVLHKEKAFGQVNA
jgi:hypothetical protein